MQRSGTNQLRFSIQEDRKIRAHLGKVARVLVCACAHNTEGAMDHFYLSSAHRTSTTDTVRTSQPPLVRVSLFKIAPSFAACPSHSLSFFHTSHRLKTMVFILSSSSLKISLCCDTGQPSEFISRHHFACVESSHPSASHPTHLPDEGPCGFNCQ